MAENTLLITAGDVIDVQLTSETVVIEGADARHLEPGHITNRMRQFVREGEGQERKYDFDDTELGVRETQRVAIVRGVVKGARAPLNLLLFNLSSGEQEAFESGLAVYLARKPLFGTIAKAVLFSILVTLVTWLAQLLFDIGYDGGMGFSLAVMFGLFAFPVFWWPCRIWDRIMERGRYQRARKRFLAEMTGRVRAYAPRAGQTPQPAQAPPPPVAEPPPAAEPRGA